MRTDPPSKHFWFSCALPTSQRCDKRTLVPSASIPISAYCPCCALRDSACPPRPRKGSPSRCRASRGRRGRTHRPLEEASNQWAFYHAKALREHQYRVQKLVLEERRDALKPESRRKLEAALQHFAEEEKRYAEETRSTSPREDSCPDVGGAPGPTGSAAHGTPVIDPDVRAPSGRTGSPSLGPGRLGVSAHRGARVTRSSVKPRRPKLGRRRGQTPGARANPGHPVVCENSAQGYAASR